MRHTLRLIGQTAVLLAGLAALYGFMLVVAAALDALPPLRMGA